MAGGGLDDDDEITGINITPMVDIMLVLLVIFMVTTTTINKIEGMEVDKPDASSGKNIDELPQSIVLMCRNEGEFAIDGQPKEPDLLKVARRTNEQMMKSVRHPLDKASIETLDRTFHETRDAYRLIMRQRMQLLQKTATED